MRGKRICRKGWVRIALSGRFPEKLLNLCIKKNICLWDVRREGAVIYCSVSPEAFRRLRPFVRTAGASVRIVEKGGRTFFLHRYHKRYFFIPGLILCFLLVELFASFVWVVEPVGLERLDAAEAKALLKEAGLYPGAWKRSISPGEVQRRVLLKSDDIVWLWPDIRGVHAYVSIKESTPVPEAVHPDDPVNIVAAADAVVRSMTVKAGEAAVREGDAVAKGDLLVSGVVGSSAGTVRWLHALGEIRGTVWTEKSREEALFEEHRTPTGAKKRQFTVGFLNFSRNLFRNSGKPYENCDKITTVKRVRIFGLETPLWIRTQEYREMTAERVAVSTEEAVKRAERVLDRELASVTEGEVISRETEAEELPNGNLRITRRMEEIREIGVSVPIREEIQEKWQSNSSKSPPTTN